MARARMWIGLDVGADRMAVCGTDEKGNVILEHNVATSASELHAILKPFKRRIELIGLESGSYGIPLTRALRRLGYPVAMFDARQVSKFLVIRQNKTDKNDARGIAEIARLGRDSVSEVHVKSAECQRLRSMLATRQKLLRLRVATEGTMRALFRLNGGKLKGSYCAAKLKQHVAEELLRLRKVEKIDLRDDVEPLFALSMAMRTYLEGLDVKLDEMARSNPVCQRFLEIPGVGAMCALSFYSAIEDPFRFRRNADVGAYLGMVPKVRQSGQNSHSLRVSKMGNRMTRSHLNTAALSHLRYADSDLTAWGMTLAERSSKQRARMAVARKLAVLMLSMWKTDMPYRAKSHPGTAVDSAEGGELPIAA